MEQNEFLMFLSRFHPLIVHLPIGFMIKSVILDFIKSERTKYSEATVIGWLHDMVEIKHLKYLNLFGNHLNNICQYLDATKFKIYM